jgi:hypothetical protein
MQKASTTRKIHKKWGGTLTEIYELDHTFKINKAYEISISRKEKVVKNDSVNHNKFSSKYKNQPSSA